MGQALPPAAAPWRMREPFSQTLPSSLGGQPSFRGQQPGEVRRDPCRVSGLLTEGAA